MLAPCQDPTRGCLTVLSHIGMDSMSVVLCELCVRSFFRLAVGCVRGDVDRDRNEGRGGVPRFSLSERARPSGLSIRVPGGFVIHIRELAISWQS